MGRPGSGEECRAVATQIAPAPLLSLALTASAALSTQLRITCRQLFPIRADIAPFCLANKFEPNFFQKGLHRQIFDDFDKQIMRIEPHGFALPGTRIIQQPADQPVYPFQLPEGLGRVFDPLILAAVIHAQQLQIPLGHPERITDFMGQTSGQPADRG